ncbi:MAG: MFS transporter [Thermoleophilia bacterium]|nr:MFS transporter [Thermoleophilia bacterium]
MTAPRIIQPLRIRDFAVLFFGLVTALLGDGIYLVAIAWQVYELSNAPTALSIVGVATTVPLVAFVLVGGVVSDRTDRRRVMIGADLARVVAFGLIAGLSLTGSLELWHLFAIVALYGLGEAFFGPAFAAIVPDIVPTDRLVEANSLNQLARPLAQRLAGPALGGAVIALAGPGGAFALAAGLFGVSAAALLLLERRPPPPASGRSFRRDVREGYRFVRSQVWIWGTLVSGCVTLLFFWGPYEVLIPYLVKNELGGGADDLGLIFASGGVGAIAAAIAIAQRGLPRRHITFMYATWTLGSLTIAVYGVASELWQAMVASFVEGACFAAGMIVWGTLLHRLVPPGLLGRVEGFDWLVSVALVPASFALTGPVAELAGTHETLLGAAVLGGLGALAFLFLPGMRDTERIGLAAASESIRTPNPMY